MSNIINANLYFRSVGQRAQNEEPPPSPPPSPEPPPEPPPGPETLIEKGYPPPPSPPPDD